jgi:hypothetical protein
LNSAGLHPYGNIFLEIDVRTELPRTWRPVPQDPFILGGERQETDTRPILIGMLPAPEQNTAPVIAYVVIEPYHPWLHLLVRFDSHPTAADVHNADNVIGFLEMHERQET